MADLMKYFIWFLSPLGIWLLFGLFALLRVFGRGSVRQWILVLAQVQLLAFSLPWVADGLFGSLESEARRLQEAKPARLANHLNAIVVLGGGMQGSYAGVRNMPDLNDTSDRVWAASRLYKQGVAPVVVVSGGGFVQDAKKQVEAQAMRELLVDLGVPADAIVLEQRSRTTLENAQQTAVQLKDLNIGQDHLKHANAWSVALVTSAFHMGRAVALFENEGFDVYPVRADVRIIPDEKSVWEYLPKPQALELSTMAIKEYMGRLQLLVTAVFKGAAGE